MTPDWYDLLDVPRDADKETIRAAWKAAVVDLDPTDRTFRVYSQAAEVLLDDERRAAYDAQLAAEAPDTSADDEPADVEGAPAPAAEPAGRATSGATAATTRRVVPGWLLLGIGLLTLLVALAATALHVTAPNDPGLRAVLGEVTWWDDDDATTSGNPGVPAAAAGAVEAAEAAVTPVTAYDYRRLDESREAALEVLTPEFGEEYEKLYEGAVRDNAVETQTVVSVTDVHASALGRVGDGFAEVLVFFDRRVGNKARSAPVVYEDQATLKMKKVDDRWLVADIITTPATE